ncbi:SDR family NAD(P)-dependent oxidoreductase [Porifericola rhodea]|uniref:SDR family NAD(P)-dependent oxidoreductase n=1 Tax=Porifericola rhodea TaxID=930972 RepID=UPI00266602FB|nr:SDR family NAD(P)-dependent oxidoreductase [Porifericola rhodea]WKN30577.1 SDR family NAD(P)-dependent oxidoreductase [Porifericola rhodea]
MSESKILTIIGMGDGISMAIARRFGQEDFTIAMVSRSNDKLDRIQKKLHRDGIEAYYYLADASQKEELTKSINYIHESLGPTDVLIYNAAAVSQINLLNASDHQLIDDFKVNTIGALNASQAVVPLMKQKGGGKIFFTGGGLATEPNPQYGSLGLGKAALRNLAQSLHQLLQPNNIHVATVTVNGFVQLSDDRYNPDAIAEQYWTLYQQNKGNQEVEISY